MADLDIVPGYEDGFTLTFGENSSIVHGNVALLNRFQITFFEEGMYFLSDKKENIIDGYGGRATSMIGVPRALSDLQGITAALTAAINNTVDSIKGNTPDEVDDTERLEKAEISDVFIKDGVVNAIVDVYPVALETSELPRFYIPITSR
jgi:hypothetical protein